MKRIEAILSGKYEANRMKNRISRIELTLQAAKLNADSKKEDNNLAIENTLEKFNDPNIPVETVISELSEHLSNKYNIAEEFKQIESIKKFLFEELNKSK